MTLVPLLLIASLAPTPLGVAVRTSGGQAASLDKSLRSILDSMLTSDNRFEQSGLPELPDPKVDLEEARADMAAGRDAFLILEAEDAKAKLTSGTRGLLMSADQLGDRTELLEAFAQRVGILAQLDEQSAARKAARQLAALDVDYSGKGVEFVNEDALVLIKKAQKRAAKAKPGRIVVKAPKRGPVVLVSIDGQDVGPAPVKAKVRPGEHVVTLHAPGSQAITRIVKVRSRKSSRVKARLKGGKLLRQLAKTLDPLEPSIVEFQEPMLEAASLLGDPSEVLFVMLGPAEAQKTLELRMLRVRIAEKKVYGSAVAPVAVDGSDLEDALLFGLEEVLLGERAAPQGAGKQNPDVSAAEPAPSEKVASSSSSSGSSASGRPSDAPSTSARGDPSSGSKDASSSSEPSSSKGPTAASSSSDGSRTADASSSATTSSTEGSSKSVESKQVEPSADSDSKATATASSSSADTSSSGDAASSGNATVSSESKEGTEGVAMGGEAEPEAGGGLWIWGAVGAAGGLSALVVVAAATAVTTGIVLSQGADSAATEGGNRDPHTTGTRWATTGLGY